MDGQSVFLPATNFIKLHYFCANTKTGRGTEQVTSD